MNEVFVDTSGWASFFLRTESHHAKAVDGQWKGYLQIDLSDDEDDVVRDMLQNDR